MIFIFTMDKYEIRFMTHFYMSNYSIIQVTSEQSTSTKVKLKVIPIVEQNFWMNFQLYNSHTQRK